MNAGWWFGTFFFHFIWDVILPIDELIFFKMVIAPESEKVNQQLGSDKTLATICNHGLFLIGHVYII